MQATTLRNPFVVGKYISDHYYLNSASSVQAAVKSLLKNEMVTYEEGVYRLSDFFFAEWLANIF